MKTLLIMCLTVLAITGCESSSDSASSSSGNSSIGGITEPAKRDLLASELVIGRRLCAALKVKREKMEIFTNLQEKFRFQSAVKACGTTMNTFYQFDVAISNANSTDIEYQAVTTAPATAFKDVITDQNGVMKIFCDNLATSNVVSNQTLSGNSYLSVSFVIKNGFDTYEVSKRTGDKLVSTESVAVITQTSQADQKFFGVEKERVRNLTCPNSTDNSSAKQTWVSALTGYPTI